MSEKIILSGLMGSHSYGVSTPESDMDFMDVVVTGEECYLGLKEWGSSGTKEQKNPKVVYEGESAHALKSELRSFNRDFETSQFEVRKFVGLCANFNPNVVPLLWLPTNKKFHESFQSGLYAELSPEGKMLVDNRNLFSSKRAYHTFCGYAHSQLQKAMGGIAVNLESQALRSGFVKFLEWAEKSIDEERKCRDNPTLTHIYDAGWLNAVIALRNYAKEEVKRIKDEPSTGRMGAKRKALREKYGYDTKYCFHTIRLLTMAKEFLLSNGESLIIDRTGIDAEFLRGIREGDLSKEEILAEADILFEDVKEAAEKTTLPNEPDREAINDLCIRVIASRFNWNL